MFGYNSERNEIGHQLTLVNYYVQKMNASAFRRKSQLAEYLQII